ncbi:unnamed protein product [Mytilus coruscus]|uniref:SRCR domain-containing protein n=1 Tax=Mytilus coruscus TaxID=42192 RepID=A0A6J8DUW7_MYTCO|nr:unnamed protein product [Mytilus coruscus]
MAKIRIYNVLLFVLEYTVLFVSVETETLKLCENSKPGLVNCPGDEKISLTKITYGELLCQDESNNNICHSNVKTYFNDHCLGQNNCTLPIEILYNNSCQKPPRRLKVIFECSRGFWWRNRHPDPVYICANSLTDVKCPSKYHIHIENAHSYSESSICDSMNNKCAINKFEHLCDEKQRCSPDTSKTSCLFHRRFATIQYTCNRSNDYSVTPTIPNTSSDHEHDTTTTSAANVTSENHELSELSLDNDHRVVIYQHSFNATQYVCSHGWDDNDAAVLCKYLNRTWTGNSTVVDKLPDIPIAPYSLNCDGLELSLFECNYTEDTTSCNTTKVAGAVCCQGTDRQGHCVTNPSPQKVSTVKPGSSTLGIAVGIPVAIIVVVCVILVIAFFRRRYIRKDSDRKFSNFMSKSTDHADDDYIGVQNIALPQYLSNKKVLYRKEETDDQTEN